MSLRFSSTVVSGAFSLPRRLPWRWFLPAAAFAILAVSAGACGGSSETTTTTSCDGDGCGTAGSGGASDKGGAGGASDTGGKGTGGASAGGGGTGGAATCDPSQAACPCDDAGMCPDDKACVMGLCIGACTFSYECGPLKVCADGACVAACNAANPCDAGYTCDSGACVLDPQNPECDETTPCLGGFICVSGICTTGCNTNLDCEEGQVCDGAAHACIPDPSPKPICDATRPCPVPQLCGVDGYCHYPCTTVGECKLVDNRFIACDASVCKTEEELSPECTIENPCPPGQSCISNKCE